MVCVAVNGKPVIGVIHKPFEDETYWGWVGQEVSEDLDSKKNTVIYLISSQKSVIWPKIYMNIFCF